MAKKRKSNQSRQAKKHEAELRRRAAAAERRREAHVRLVFDRQGDPRFIQQERTETGRTLSWSRESETGKQMQEALQGQLDAFTAKFGREPGPEDPIFFDPNCDEPVPMRPESEAQNWAELYLVAEEAGLDPAYIRAWEELGYIVTEMNQHLFSAQEVEEYLQAVRRFDTQPGGEDDFIDEDLTGDVFDDVGRDLELAVAQTLLAEGADAPALRFLDNLMESLGDSVDAEEIGEVVTAVHACLLGWLVGARETGIAAESAVAWVKANLSEDAAAATERVSGLIGFPLAPDLTVSQVLDELGPLAIAAMIWLAAGVAASAGAGDANWLRQFDTW